MSETDSRQTERKPGGGGNQGQDGTTCPLFGSAAGKSAPLTHHIHQQTYAYGGPASPCFLARLRPPLPLYHCGIRGWDWAVWSDDYRGGSAIMLAA